MSKKQNLYSMTAAALLTALICILAPLSVPIGPVSLTLQNFVIGLAAVILGWKLALVSCAVYLLLGMVGLPVFSGYAAGVDKLAGPTGGYLIGFLFFVAISGFLISLTVKKWGQKSPVTYAAAFAALVVGDAVLYVFGTAWFIFVQKVTLPVAMVNCVYPFIIPDLIKFVLATAIGLTVRSALGRAGILTEFAKA